MKPSFALDLRDEAVTLLHRTSRGWQQVGATRFDAPDLAEALAYMRATALGLSPRGIATKLIIPNDQILFTQVTISATEQVKRKRQIKAALDGLTPYPVEELVYDQHGTGSEVQVAVIARETLDQAEAFAAEHRFNPVCFVAVPEDGAFVGEPYFGLTKMAPALLSDGEAVERDSEAVFTVARDLPKAEPAARVAEAIAEPVATPEPEIWPETDTDTAAPTPPDGQGTDAPMAAVDVAQSPVPDAMSVLTLDAQTDADRTDGPATIPAYEAPMALDVQPEEPPAPLRPEDLTRSLAAVPKRDAPAGDVDDDLPPAPAEAVRAALAARRTQTTSGAPSLGAVTADVARPAAVKPMGAMDNAAQKPGAKSAKPNATGRPLKPGRAMVTAPGIAGVARSKVISRPIGSQPGSAATDPDATRGMDRGKPMTGLGGRPVPVKGRPRYLGLILTGILLVFLALIAAWSSFFLAGLGTDQSVPAATAISQAAVPDTTAQTATADGTADPAATTQTAIASTAEPSAADEAAADGQDAVAAAASEQDSTAPAADQVAAAATETAADTAAAMADQSTNPPADAVASNATSAETTPAAPVAAADAGPAPAADSAVSAEVAANGTGTQTQTAGDEIFLATIEPSAQVPDPASLPGVSDQGDVLPDAAPPPLPFGTVYQFDAEGRIQPTKDGILTPEGVLLVAGKPKLVPPTRPAAIAALAPVVAVATAPAADATAIAAAPAVTAPAATPGAISLTGPQVAVTSAPTPDAAPLLPDPSKKGFKPKSRPASLVPAAAATDPAPDPATQAHLASVKPRSRSSSALIVAQNSAQPAEASAGSTAGLQTASLAADVSGLAVDISRLPVARPAGRAQAVNAAVNDAVNAALAQPDPPAADAQANAAPEAQSEPEVATAMPKIPTSASVAKTATEKNALALSKVALIGVFGSDNSRYAYVRLANGTLKKVKPGDALDGGQVVAISANDLRYQKNGQLVVLKMPREG